MMDEEEMIDIDLEEEIVLGSVSADEPIPGSSAVLSAALPCLQEGRCILCKLDTGEHLRTLTPRGIPAVISECRLTKKDCLADCLLKTDEGTVLLVHQACRDDLRY